MQYGNELIVNIEITGPSADGVRVQSLYDFVQDLKTVMPIKIKVLDFKIPSKISAEKMTEFVGVQIAIPGLPITSGIQTDYQPFPAILKTFPLSQLHLANVDRSYKNIIYNSTTREEDNIMYTAHTGIPNILSLRLLYLDGNNAQQLMPLREGERATMRLKFIKG